MLGRLEGRRVSLVGRRPLLAVVCVGRQRRWCVGLLVGRGRVEGVGRHMRSFGQRPP